MIKIFARAWWKFEDGVKVPDGAAHKSFVKYVDTQEEAREYCNKHNAHRSADWIRVGRKYEFSGE